VIDMATNGRARAVPRSLDGALAGPSTRFTTRAAHELVHWGKDSSIYGNNGCDL